MKVSPDRYVRIAESLFEADPERRAEALDVLDFFRPPRGKFLPHSEIIAAHASDVDQMMRGPNAETQVIACSLAESAGGAFDPYLQSLIVLANNDDHFTRVSTMAYEALAGLSMTSDNALKAFIDLYQRTEGRDTWRDAAERLREHRKEIAELLDPP